MRRIVRCQACCLRRQDYRESSLLVTLFTETHGVIHCLARGARRPRSRLSAALDRLALAQIIYYFREDRQLFNLSDADLIRSFSGVAKDPARFLAAEQITELCLRALRPHDPNPRLFHLLITYLAELDSDRPVPTSTLVCSFLLKAASFLGFKPELHRCIACAARVSGTAWFDTGRGGTLCPACGSQRRGLLPLSAEEQQLLQALIFTPAAQLPALGHLPEPLTLLALRFVEHHFQSLTLNSFRWTAPLNPTLLPGTNQERNVSYS